VGLAFDVMAFEVARALGSQRPWTTAIVEA
jgi:hypothetical protein